MSLKNFQPFLKFRASIGLPINVPFHLCDVPSLVPWMPVTTYSCLPHTLPTSCLGTKIWTIHSLSSMTTPCSSLTMSRAALCLINIGFLLHSTDLSPCSLSIHNGLFIPIKWNYCCPIPVSRQVLTQSFRNNTRICNEFNITSSSCLVISEYIFTHATRSYIAF